MPKRPANPVRKQVRVIRKSLKAIEKSLAKLVAATNGMGLRIGVRRGLKGRKLRLTAKRKAALKVQGAYIGHMRNLKPAHKAQVKAARASKGMLAAISLAKRLAKS